MSSDLALAINLPKLSRYLEEPLELGKAPLEATAFKGGFSNLTFRLTSGDRHWVLRRPPMGPLPAKAHDMVREFKVLEAIKPHFKYAPTPLICCNDSRVLGAPFYVMSYVQGPIIQQQLPKAMAGHPQLMSELCRKLVAGQAAIHSVPLTDPAVAGLGKPEGYLQRQVAGWCQRYEAARTPESVDATALQTWLQENQPQEPVAATLVHNDYKFDNVVWDDQYSQLQGVLDWEMATVGHPLMDFGNGLAYWVQADDTAALKSVAMMPTFAEGALTRRELVEHYCEARGVAPDSMTYYYTFGLFRLAVIAQQIYARYRKTGQGGARFSGFGQMARLLIAHGVGVVENPAKAL